MLPGTMLANFWSSRCCCRPGNRSRSWLCSARPCASPLLGLRDESPPAIRSASHPASVRTQPRRRSPRRQPPRGPLHRSLISLRNSSGSQRLPIMRCRARGFADARTSGLASSQYTSNFIVFPLRSIQHDQKLGGQRLRADGTGVRAAVHLDKPVALQMTQGARQVAGRSA